MRALEAPSSAGKESDMKKIAVVGGGAAGMMAAARLIEENADVTLFERNDRLGKKLAITGKGRCNLTNNCSLPEFMENVPANPRFLYSAVSAFSCRDVMRFFEERGVPLKTERGNRVFPVSDRAGDIVRVLRTAVEGHVRFARVTGLLASDGSIRGLRAGGREEAFDAVILCTGGLSYPATGSDGDGYRMAAQLGHTITELIPSLVPIVSPDRFCAELQGLSLRNVAASIVDRNGKVRYSDFGEMMFTHYGVTGPMILSASSMIPDLAPDRYTLLIDLKPALDEKTLDTRLLSDFSKNLNRDFSNSLGALLPSKLIPVFVAKTGIPPARKVNSITKEERRRIISLLKSFPVRLSRFRPIDEAIITRGGVAVNEINPKTMESKLVRGLYFAGEILDVNGFTGGFNLQIAFSTAVCAANAALRQNGIPG